MTELATHIGNFLTSYLPDERRASPHTVLSYADSIRLLVLFVADKCGARPCTLRIDHFTVPTILGFLASLERDRGNGVGTRNTRLAAVKSFFRYLEYRDPACLDHALQVRSITMKRADRPLIDWLDTAEMQALLDAPDITTVPGIRDRAMLYLAYAAGLRVSELTSLMPSNLSWPKLDSVRVMGKGRRERELPLWRESASVLSQWLEVRPQSRTGHVFLDARGNPMSRDGFAYRLDIHVATAAVKTPSLAGKRVTPHAPHSETQLRREHAPGNGGHKEGGALARAFEHSKHGSLPPHQSRRQARGPCRQFAPGNQERFLQGCGRHSARLAERHPGMKTNVE